MEDRVVGPLRELRQGLREGLPDLQRAGSAVLRDDATALAALEGALTYLETRYLPHQQAEEFTLYTTLAGVMGGPGTTDAMLAQHEAITAMAGDLRKVAAAVAQAGSTAEYRHLLAPLLFGLYAVIRTHLEAEDVAYLDLLDDHLSESQVEVLVENIGRISGGVAPPEVTKISRGW